MHLSLRWTINTCSFLFGFVHNHNQSEKSCLLGLNWISGTYTRYLSNNTAGYWISNPISDLRYPIICPDIKLDTEFDIRRGTGQNKRLYILPSRISGPFLHSKPWHSTRGRCIYSFHDFSRLDVSLSSVVFQHRDQNGIEWTIEKNSFLLI